MTSLFKNLAIEFTSDVMSLIALVGIICYIVN